MGDTWYLGEVFVNIRGRQQYLWRAVDEDGDVIDILMQSRRNRRAAIRFFRKLLKGQGCVPRRLITDKLRSYSAARHTVMPSVVHCRDRYANNRAEVSHQPTRQRERQMQRRGPLSLHPGRRRIYSRLERLDVFLGAHDHAADPVSVEICSDDFQHAIPIHHGQVPQSSST